jgi:hypothetical protein
MPWRSFSERDRLDRTNGTHGNQVIRFFFGGAGTAANDQAFNMMDRWLAAIESDLTALPLEQKVINNKPADVQDACFNTSGGTPAQVDASQNVGLDSPACLVKPFASPRVAAGGPMAENIFKCQLKPFNPLDADYNGAAFDAGQLARLTAVFPNGVCNWTLPGVGQADSELTTFKNGPGGMPMAPAPVSVAIP